MNRPFPAHPLEAVYMHWTSNPNREPGSPFATANGDDISSNTPEGVLRRLETWLRKNDIGGWDENGVADGAKTQPVVVEVMQQKAIVLTPVGRTMGPTSADWGNVIQNFDVKLWWQGKEYESLRLDFRTVVWSSEKRARRRKEKKGQVE